MADVLIQRQNSAFPPLVDQLPICASSCLTAAVAGSPCVDPTNPSCFCSDKLLQQAFQSCIGVNCTVTEAFSSINATQTACGLPVRDRSEPYDTVFITLTAFNVFLVAERIVFKLVKKLQLHLDDLFAVLAVTFVLMTELFDSIGTVPNGFGRDIWTLPPHNITNVYKFFYLEAIFYVPAQSCIKLSLLFFYLRIFTKPSTSTAARRMLYAAVVITSCFAITFTILSIFPCTPVSYYWQSWDGEHKGTCIDLPAGLFALSAVTISVNIFLLVFPLWYIRNLHVRRGQKAGVAAMFIVGTLVSIFFLYSDVVFSIVRLDSLRRYMDTTNPTWDYIPFFFWSGLEICFGIVCISMPSLRMLVASILPLIVRPRMLESVKSDTSSSRAQCFERRSNTGQKVSN